MTEWDRCRPWIEAALEYTDGSHDIEDIANGIESGRYWFWPGKRCAVVTEFYDYPKYRALNFFLFGGDLDELLNEMEPSICIWAKAAGCSRVFGVGRKGFTRMLKAKGYSEKWTCCVKDLDK